MTARCCGTATYSPRSAGAAMIAGVDCRRPRPARNPRATDLGGTVDADQICQVHSATPTYTIDMSFPLDYPDQQALTDFLTQDRDEFVDWIAKIRPGERNRPYVHDVEREDVPLGNADLRHPEPGARTSTTTPALPMRPPGHLISRRSTTT